MTFLVGCMMAMNASDLLKVSLASLRTNVDDVIVVDGGSIDSTRSIAEGMGATVVDSPWPSDNALQRQVYVDAALERYHGRDDVWLMVLDADELLSGGELRSLVQELNRSGKDYARLPRMWVVATAGGLEYLTSKPHYPDYQLRLFRLRGELRYSGKIHEVLHGLGPGLDVAAPTIVHLDLIRTDSAQRSQKVKRYEKLEPGSGVPRFYLPQRYGFILKPLPIDDSVRPYLSAVTTLTRVVLTPRDLHGKSLRYQLTWPLVDLWEWSQLKATRLRRRISRAGSRSLAQIRGRFQ